MSTLISVKNLGKHFGPIKAVDDISFDVSEGEVLGFLGPNGAGKSTTMKMLTCFMAPDFGTATINGHSILDNPLQVRQSIGYLPESAPAYEDMTVEKFLHFVADVRSLKGTDKSEKLAKAFQRVQINSVLNQSIGTLSKGYKRRVGLAQAILHDPRILILDEPTDGLDPNQKFEVRQLIRDMAKDKVIILSTHILEEVDEVCTRTIIISNGKIVADGTPEDLHQKSPHHGMVDIIIDQDREEDAVACFNAVEAINQVKAKTAPQGQCRLHLYPKGNETLLETVLETCRDKNWAIHHIAVDRGRLAEVFRDVTCSGVHA